MAANVSILIRPRGGGGGVRPVYCWVTAVPQGECLSLSQTCRERHDKGGGTPEHACGLRMTRRCQQGINSSVSDPYSFDLDPDPAF
jgi:hypothetical protein